LAVRLIQSEVRNRIAFITLNRPAALNALMAEYGLQAASSRLVEALNERVRES